ncbi:MAG: hypothetical protein R3B83_04600 [Nitrospirales bacterium]|nr:hypothetical protein [Nitrospirales bacterium]
MLIRPVGRDSAQSNSFPNGTLLDWRHRFYLMEAGAYWMFYRCVEAVDRITVNVPATLDSCEDYTCSMSKNMLKMIVVPNNLKEFMPRGREKRSGIAS